MNVAATYRAVLFAQILETSSNCVVYAFLLLHVSELGHAASRRRTC